MHFAQCAPCTPPPCESQEHEAKKGGRDKKKKDSGALLIENAARRRNEQSISKHGTRFVPRFVPRCRGRGSEICASQLLQCAHVHLLFSAVDDVKLSVTPEGIEVVERVPRSTDAKAVKELGALLDMMDARKKPPAPATRTRLMVLLDRQAQLEKMAALFQRCNRQGKLDKTNDKLMMVMEEIDDVLADEAAAAAAAAPSAGDALGEEAGEGEE